jgi:hypothetical protein
MPVAIQRATPTALIIDVNASGKNLRPTIMKMTPKPITHHSLLLGIAPPGIALGSWVKRLWFRLAVSFWRTSPLSNGGSSALLALTAYLVVMSRTSLIRDVLNHC